MSVAGGGEVGRVVVLSRFAPRGEGPFIEADEGRVEGGDWWSERREGEEEDAVLEMEGIVAASGDCTREMEVEVEVGERMEAESGGVGAGGILGLEMEDWLGVCSWLYGPDSGSTCGVEKGA